MKKRTGYAIILLCVWASAAIGYATATIIPHYSLRSRAAIARNLSLQFTDVPYGEGYLLGMAAAFDIAADEAGEPAQP